MSIWGACGDSWDHHDHPKTCPLQRNLLNWDLFGPLPLKRQGGHPSIQPAYLIDSILPLHRWPRIIRARRRNSRRWRLGRVLWTQGQGVEVKGPGPPFLPSSATRFCTISLAWGSGGIVEALLDLCSGFVFRGFLRNRDPPEVRQRPWSGAGYHLAKSRTISERSKPSRSEPRKSPLTNFPTN